MISNNSASPKAGDKPKQTFPCKSKIFYLKFSNSSLCWYTLISMAVHENMYQIVEKGSLCRGF